MPFPATVFNVLIASPSDVPAERDAIASCIHSWNALNSEETGEVLLPVMWESHSAPSMADRPQEVINKQLVQKCDMLIGAFWARLGSPTGLEASGTVEEIKWFLKQRRPVMLYFSKALVAPDSLDMEQWKALKAFKAELTSKGLFEQYESVPELTQKLARQLTIVMREIRVGTVVDTRAVQRAIATAESETTTALNANESEEVFLEYYTARSFLVRGNTLHHREQLKELGNGSWITPKTGGKAWCFSNKRLAEVSALLGIEPKLRSPPTTQS